MNALTLVRSALAEWRRNRGNESLYYACQHFDGWYVQWAFEGFTRKAERTILRYSTAQLAANAAPMRLGVTKVNDKRIQPGDNLYFRYGKPGHVVTAVGWDGDRLLVSDTSNSGDTVIKLTNNVKITHADTLKLPFVGASARNGRNLPRTGLTAYQHSTPAGGGGTPVPKPTPTPDPEPTPRKDLDMATLYGIAKDDINVYALNTETGDVRHVTAEEWLLVNDAYAAAGVPVPYSRRKLSKKQMLKLVEDTKARGSIRVAVQASGV
jgi:hypothetical protein